MLPYVNTRTVNNKMKKKSGERCQAYNNILIVSYVTEDPRCCRDLLSFSIRYYKKIHAICRMLKVYDVHLQ